MGKAGRPAGKANVTPTQKQEIASRRVQGQAVNTIARDMKLGRETVARQLARPDTQALMTRLRDKHTDRIERCFGRFMERLEGSIEDPKSEDWLESGDRLLRIIDQGDRAVLKAPAGGSGGLHAAITGDMGDILGLYAELTGRGY